MARYTSERTASDSKRQVYTDDYTYDDLARSAFVREVEEEEPRRLPISHEARRNREKAHFMSLGYVAFLMGAFCLVGLVLGNYLMLQSQITRMAKTVSAKEEIFNSLKLSNDEEEARIESSVDLEEIKRIAIGELGMTYAAEGQIVTYEYEPGDYLRNVSGE